MYTVSVEARFTATHSVRYPDGTLEAPHSHEWAVRAYFSSPEFDDAGMVVDFGHARSVLEQIVGGLNRTDLSANPALGGANPTAEAAARHVFNELVRRGLTQTRAVAVTEAPGCVAIFEHPGEPQCRTGVWFDDVWSEP